MNKLFFRVGNFRTNTIDEVEYKSFIINIFQEHCDLDIAPDSIKLIENRDYGGYKNFSFITLPEGTDVRAVIQAIDRRVTSEGYELATSEAQDRKQDGGFQPRYRK